MNKFLLTLITTFSFFFIFTSTTLAAEKSIIDTLNPATKNCRYIQDASGKNGGKYQPFSDIGTDFPALGKMLVSGRDGEKSCIDVANGGTENLLSLLFTTAISIIIVLTVINLTVAGIQYMTEQATGQIKGGARKRLKDSIIALALGLLSYTILYTVNKQLVEFTFDPVSIDINNSVASGVNSANNAQTGGYSSGLGGIEFVGPPSPYNPFTAPSPTGWVYTQTGLPCTPLTPLSLIAPSVTQTTDASGRACVKQGAVSRPGFAEITTPGNVSTFASFGSIRCSGVNCSSSKPTVFGYKDGDGTVGMTGDNGIGNALWSDKPGCTYDTGNTITMGVALPQGFWRAVGIPFSEVKYLGVKVFVNGVAQRILPVVDDSQSNLDFTFAAARSMIDPTITNSNSLNTAGKSVTFQIVRDYYKTNPKQNIVWTSNKSTFTNKLPCNY
jgi:hypothetical protein